MYVYVPGDKKHPNYAFSWSFLSAYSILFEWVWVLTTALKQDFHEEIDIYSKFN